MNMKKGILYFAVFVFSFAVFYSFTNDSEEEVLLGDVSGNIISFNEVTSSDKIVLFDNQESDYIKYYVIEFYGDEYAIYTYYYLDNHNDYVNKYAEVSKLIVDYNYNEFMIKTLDATGYESYDEVMSLLGEVLDRNLVYMIY